MPHGSVTCCELPKPFNFDSSAILMLNMNQGKTPTATKVPLGDAVFKFYV
jgi:hypothetical protein